MTHLPQHLRRNPIAYLLCGVAARARGRWRLRVRGEQDEDDHGLRGQGDRRPPSPQRMGSASAAKPASAGTKRVPRGRKGSKVPQARREHPRSASGRTSQTQGRCSPGKVSRCSMCRPARTRSRSPPLPVLTGPTRRWSPSRTPIPRGADRGRVPGCVVRQHGHQPDVHGVHGRGRGRLVHADRPHLHGDGRLHVEHRWSHGR